MTGMTGERAIHRALREELGRDPAVLLMGEGVATKHRDLVDAALGLVETRRRTAVAD
jgi:pyruvate/2-oxoglutarate/acetoin dehydrogenase E1 component